MTDSTLTDEQLDACFQVIEAQCVERGLTITRLTDAPNGYIGVCLQGATREWRLYVDGNETKLKLPNLFLEAPGELLAHVSYGGTVCVTDGQGLSIDPERHNDIVAYTVLAGYDLLENSASDAASGMTEFFNELEGYWSSLPKSQRYRAAVEIDGSDRLITAYVANTKKPPERYFAERNKPLPREFHAEKVTTQRALYIHLNEFPQLPAPLHQLDANFIEAIRSRLSAPQLDLWAQFVEPSKKGPKQLALLVSVPRQAGGLSLVGMLFGANRGVIDSNVKVSPFTVRRHTSTYMRERGGASLNLMKKHIAVLGCGAVGAVVADTLATAGIGKLTLVDNDLYSEDNVFRHVLDPHWIGIPKASAMKIEFERRYPGIQVKAAPITAQQWLHAANLVDLDGIIVAFGAPSIERMLSKRLRDKSVSLPVIFTWLEALDLGGHSVLTWTNHEGCLDCLYRDDEGQPALHSRTSFMEPGQRVSRNLTGCTSVFVPFGALQARRTGLLAAEHMLNALNGDVKPSYRYWVGEGIIAEKEGLITTNWWKAAEKTSQAEATLRVFGRPCKHCRGNA